MKKLLGAININRIKEIVLTKKVIVPSVAVLLAVAVLIVVFGGKAASVMEVIGSASITRGDKTFDAKPGGALKTGDTVRADAACGIWLRLDEHKTVLFAGAGELKLVNLKKNFTLQLESGALLVRNDKPLKTGESFEILWGSIRLVVNGAAVFSVQLDSEDNAVLNVYQGEVDVYGPNENKLTTLGKGLSIRLNPQTGELIGEAVPIDYQALHGVIAEYVRDYEAETEFAKEEEAPPPPKPSAPSSEAQSEPEQSELQDEPEQSALPEEPNEPATPAETSVPPSNETSAIPDGPAPPTAIFRYIWNGTEFKPCADISWSQEHADHILWQLFDQNGNGLTEEAQIEGNGAISVNNYTFDVSSWAKNGLYPMGYTIRLTPFYTTGEDAEPQPMAQIVMPLPYFEVAAEKDGDVLNPVISTNIGLYFVHSHGSLSDTEENGKLKIQGSLMPAEGEKVPLNINVLSK